MVQNLNTDKAPKAVGPYSHATTAGGFLFSSGQIPLNPQSGEMVEGGIEEQTAQVLDNLKAVLEEAGLGWEDVVKTTIYLSDLSTFQTVNQIYEQALNGAKPARSTVQVAGLPKGALIEIDLVAALRG